MEKQKEEREKEQRQKSREVEVIQCWRLCREKSEKEKIEKKRRKGEETAQGEGRVEAEKEQGGESN